MNWRVPKIWEGGDVWIIGGGPSLAEQFEIPTEVVQAVMEKEIPISAYSPYLAPLHAKHVIGINAAFLLGTWMDMMFFGDVRFFLENRKELAQFNKLKVTCSMTANVRKYAKGSVKYLPKNASKSKGISEESHRVCWNGNSGAAAISVAANAGAARIILLGFDMTLGQEEAQHWHTHYQVNGKKVSPQMLPFSKHLLCFDAIAKDAQKRGIEIINASPNSAITQFRKQP